MACLSTDGTLLTRPSHLLTQPPLALYVLVALSEVCTRLIQTTYVIIEPCLFTPDSSLLSMHTPTLRDLTVTTNIVTFSVTSLRANLFHS